ncbi:mannosyl-3-phosphoglycerate phosphatase-related protein [Atlantibacter sp.]|uniref:mannosyl-3-phosphoglycerate phosphatase-related protein n=1 Tax=Atlantibacter sp. TaxID=1903473 RepID=UPI0028A88D43|nr:mannosyl-3-phosphoglycerate phosphatase-related protein [Atlantibacter sp.]
MPSLTEPLLIVSDLDGCLIDSHTRHWAAALPMLDKLREQNIPVILCSSKTAAETIAIQNELGLQGEAFIAENGAVIHLNEEWDDHPDYPRLINGDTHESIRKVLEELRQSQRYKFTTYDDLDDHTIGEITGLPPKMIALAKLQEASQTLIWRDSDERLAAFSEDLNNLGLCMMEGGHFWHVLDQRGGKGSALTWLIDQYRHREGVRPGTIAIGDSPNDVTMLDVADYAVVVQGYSKQPVVLKNDTPQRVYRTQAYGPAGWCEGLDYFLGSSVR